MVRKLMKILILASALALISCQLTPVPFTETEILLNVPVTFEDMDMDSIEVTAYNTATGRIISKLTDTNGVVKILLEEGVYNFSVHTGKEIYTNIDGLRQTQRINLRAMNEKQVIVGEMYSFKMPLLFSVDKPGFVIKEIYFAGSTTPARGSYFQDQFIEVFNNSDSILYADGLSIVEGSHLSSHASPQYAEYPDDFIVGALYSIPGDGKNHPVMPGKSIVIASMAINHSAVNINSPVDMSEADFEWFDAGKDVDVPEVPNMIRNFCYSNTLWVMHVRGYKAYAIFKSPINYNAFIRENSINVLTPSGSSVTRIKVPKHLIIDGVELGSSGNIGSKALSPEIDLGYTHCLATYNGRSVRRKVSHFVHGRAYLIDTNNSSIDFIPNTQPKPRITE